MRLTRWREQAALTGAGVELASLPIRECDVMPSMLEAITSADPSRTPRGQKLRGIEEARGSKGAERRAVNGRIFQLISS